MRKLRQDITILEVCDAIACSPTVRGEYLDRLGDDLRHGTVTQTYPDSFYEQPPVGSYGRFWKPNSSDRWGYYTGSGTGKEFPYSCSDGFVYQTFTPGLPTDVDADGMPK